MFTRLIDSDAKKFQKLCVEVFEHNPLGRDLLHMMNGMYDPDQISSSDVNQVYFRLGQRDVVRTIKSAIEASNEIPIEGDQDE